MLGAESRLMFAAFVGSGWYKWGWIDYAVVAVTGAIVVIHLARMRLKAGRNADISPPEDRQRGWKNRRSRKRKK
jgi:hypothetical protein